MAVESWLAETNLIAVEQGSEVVNRMPMAILLLWSFISTIVFVLGVGFAGGVSDVFMGPPATADFISKALWLIAWLMVAAPFALLPFRLARYLGPKRPDQ